MLREYFDYRQIRQSLNSTEIYAITMLLFCSVLDLIYFKQIEQSALLLIVNFGVFVYLSFSAIYFKNNPQSKLIFIYKSLFIGICYIFYQQMQSYIRVSNPFLYDDLLIKVDYSIFGTNPTQALKEISNKYLTEYLQIAYASFYITSLIIAIELYKSKKRSELNEFVDLMSFGFYISYLAYFLFPAVGPRFTLHNFAMTNLELPGLFLTDFLRDFVNTGGGIPHGVSNPEFYVNRDCFPSGHTMLTLMNIIAAFKFKTKVRYFVLIIGSSLIFSTVYLRYHYVIDVVFGVIFCLFAYLIEQRIRKYINNRILFRNGKIINN